MIYIQLVHTRLSSLLATMDANLCSPASSDMRKTYSGAVTWFDLWVLPVTKQEQTVWYMLLFQVYDMKKAQTAGFIVTGTRVGFVFMSQRVNIYWPNCCIALSALHGSSSVMWTLRRWFFTRRSACREIPELAASEMMAMFWLKTKTIKSTFHMKKWNDISESLSVQSFSSTRSKLNYSGGHSNYEPGRWTIE